MKALVGDGLEKHTGQLAESLRDSTRLGSDRDVQPGSSALPTDADEVVEIAEPATDEQAAQSSPTILIEPIQVGKKNTTAADPTNDNIEKSLVTSDNIEVKKEELRSGKRFLTFTTEEDKFLRKGVEKYEKSTKKWADILKDKDYHFKEGRTRDSLRVRATSLGLDKSKKKNKNEKT